MKFDWERFFRKHNIRYVTSGKNTKSGEYSIPCPWCNRTSNKDPSEHLGVNPSTGSFFCWRNNKHRGNQPVYLIMHLIGCSNTEACEIYGITRPDPSELEAAISRLCAGQILANESKRP